ncbi:MAG: hypothetical protein IJN43_13765 [Ruminococcus sp.]|nr:hypothetical protein [Ruminococcus sp.]
MTNLKDTVDLMNSADYKERFIAEYWQTKIRYEKLKEFNTKIEAEELVRYTPSPYSNMVNARQVKHDCPREVLRDQQRIMGEYLHILELRAVFENIDLNAPMRCVGEAKE